MGGGNRSIAADLLGRQLVFSGGCLEVLEPEFHLLEEPRLALRAPPEKLAPQLLDGEPEMGDLRFDRGCCRLGGGGFGLGGRGIRLRGQPRSPLGEDHRVSGLKVGGEQGGGGRHASK